MSGRNSEEYYRKGSSRRDREYSPGEENYRQRDKDRHGDHRRSLDRDRFRNEDRNRSRSERSRSPRDNSRSKSPWSDEETENKYVYPKTVTTPVPDLSGFRQDLNEKQDSEDGSDDLPPPPPPPRISKVSLTLGKPTTSNPPAIQMKLGGFKLGGASKQGAVKKPISVASAFNQDSDDEQEEMPTEARMRMRNIGRETPTSAGPNSYGKTKHGFCDSQKMFEKNLREAMNK